MAEMVNGGSSSQPPKEMSMELRLLVAFLLMGVVMFVTPYLFKNQAPAPGKTPQTTAQGSGVKGQGSGAPAAVAIRLLPESRGTVAHLARVANPWTTC